VAAAKNPQTGPNPKKAPKRNRSKPDDVMFEETRAKIQTTQIVNRLNNYTLNGKDPKTKKPIEMSTGQIRAAEILLSKSLPSLQSTTIEANVTATLTLEKLTDTELDEQLKELQDKG